MTWNARPVAPHNANSRPRHLTALVRLCRWLQSQCVASAAYVAITNAGFRHFFLLNQAKLIGRSHDSPYRCDRGVEGALLRPATTVADRSGR